MLYLLYKFEFIKNILFLARELDRRLNYIPEYGKNGGKQDRLQYGVSGCRSAKADFVFQAAIGLPY